MTKVESEVMIQNLSTLRDLLIQQSYFQSIVGLKLPKDIITFENVSTALEHNTYQQIEFQEFMESDNYEKKEELIDYLLFMLNKYLFLGVNTTMAIDDVSLKDALWGNDNEEYSSSAASCYASIEQYEFIKMIRNHCIFKPWKVKVDKSCAEIEYVFRSFCAALEHFRKLARMTYDSYYDMHACIIKKLMINIDRQNNAY